jgi:hypothetical protein
MGLSYHMECNCDSDPFVRVGDVCIASILGKKLNDFKPLGYVTTSQWEQVPFLLLSLFFASIGLFADPVSGKINHEDSKTTGPFLLSKPNLPQFCFKSRGPQNRLHCLLSSFVLIGSICFVLQVAPFFCLVGNYVFTFSQLFST